VTDPGPRRAAGRGGWPQGIWGPLVLVGLLLITLAVLADLHRGRGPARSGHGVPLVNVGSLPAGGGAGARGQPAGRHESHGRSTPLPAGARLRLARFGVDAPISDVTTVGHVMQIPRDPHTVGWWSGGAAPGDAAGTAVIVGHINYAGVSGALAVLPDARPGDSVVVSTAHGDSRYRVVAVRSYPKATGIPADVFSRTGAPRLVLITCGGRFDSATGNYEANIVAYAQPL
jgi:hypothetical protein